MINDGMNSFLFSTPEMTRVFSPAEQLRAMTRFEWALSCALEKQRASGGGFRSGAGALARQPILLTWVLWCLRRRTPATSPSLLSGSLLRR